MIKHFLGLFFGYGWIIASTFFGASGFAVFLGYTAELFILLLLYTIYRIIDHVRNPRKYDRQQSVLTLWVAATPVIAIHFVGIRFVLENSNPLQKIPTITNVMVEWQTWIAVIALFLFYLLNFMSKPVAKVVDLARNRFMVGLLLLTVINMVGIIVFSQMDSPDFIIVISAMVLMRFIAEFFLNRQFNLIDEN